MWSPKEDTQVAKMSEATYRAIREVYERDLVEVDLHAERERARLKGQIEQLDKTWAQLAQLDESGTATAPARTTPRNGTLLALVRGALDVLPVEFQSPDVWAALKAKNPEYQDTKSDRASVAGALRMLTENQHIQMVERGAGKRSAKFRKADVGGVAANA